MQSASVLSDIREKEGTSICIGRKINHKTSRGHIGRSKPWSHRYVTAFRIECDMMLTFVFAWKILLSTR